jgi:hypothetical protein
MFDNQIDNRYKSLLKYLISNGYKCKKEPSQRLYQCGGVVIKFTLTDIVINDYTDNRRFYFKLDSSNTFLINFLSFLTNNKKVVV